jgi:hypothetical protein
LITIGSADRAVFCIACSLKSRFWCFAPETCYSLNGPQAVSAGRLSANDRSHRINSRLEALSNVKVRANAVLYDARLPFGAVRGAVSS